VAQGEIMKHPVTGETKEVLEALGHIRQRVQPRLDRVSPAAREEWVKLLLRFPSDEDVGEGLIGIAPATLAEMISKARRFEQILRSAGSPEGGTVAQQTKRYPDEPTI
jgi:hypothetical protein